MTGIRTEAYRFHCHLAAFSVTTTNNIDFCNVWGRIGMDEQASGFYICHVKMKIVSNISFKRSYTTVKYLSQWPWFNYNWLSGAWKVDRRWFHQGSPHLWWKINVYCPAQKNQIFDSIMSQMNSVLSSYQISLISSLILSPYLRVGFTWFLFASCFRATRKKINTVNRKQTSIQSSTHTHMDLWNSAMGYGLKSQHRNPPALPIQDSPIHSECTTGSMMIYKWTQCSVK
jgi:hypothetical protein